VIIVGIAKRIALRLEHEPCSFDFFLHADRIDAMQCLGIPQTGAEFSHVIDDQENTSRFQGVEKGLIQRAQVGWSHK
jgi:hypothetical protein